MGAISSQQIGLKMSVLTRTQLASTVLVLGAIAVAAPAVAGERHAERHGYNKHRHSHSSVRVYGHRYYSSRSYDRIRANDYDPAGAYRDYPDWARYALSPKR